MRNRVQSVREVVAEYLHGKLKLCMDLGLHFDDI